MSRCVMVLGIPRSGTSAVAGVLHALGVDMGEGHLQAGNQWNEKGYVEDLRWQVLNKAITGERYGHEQPEQIGEAVQAQYRRLARLCNQTAPLWGMKDPRLCFTAQFIWPNLEDVRVVAVYRAPSASVQSLMHHSWENYGGKYAMNPPEARALLDTWAEAMRARLQEFQGPVLRIRYENLVKKPAKGVDRLGRFAFEGLGLVPDYKAGRQVVDAGLNHYG